MAMVFLKLLIALTELFYIQFHLQPFGLAATACHHEHGPTTRGEPDAFGQRIFKCFAEVHKHIGEEGTLALFHVSTVTNACIHNLLPSFQISYAFPSPEGSYLAKPHSEMVM